MAATTMPPPLLLVAAAALIAVVTATVAAGAGEGPACDTAHCGRGQCVEQPGPLGLDTFRCDCDAGWSNMFAFLPASPCTIPKCTFDSACFNITFNFPRGFPLTDPCVAINCGSGGECVKEEGLSYHCACSPGFVNMFNLTMFPCIKNCAFGKDCSALGLSPPGSPPPPPPPSPSSSSPATPGNDSHDSSGHPSSPKGNASTVATSTTSLGYTITRFFT
uniref:EGF-like domain-containing protein n=1 Tax=Oryza glumipatula TaxID=40148 RepID=A0A0E0BAM3_9ORYZ